MPCRRSGAAPRPFARRAIDEVADRHRPSADPRRRGRSAARPPAPRKTAPGRERLDLPPSADTPPQPPSRPVDADRATHPMSAGPIDRRDGDRRASGRRRRRVGLDDPASAFTISPSAQNAIPSPYGATGRAASESDPGRRRPAAPARGQAVTCRCPAPRNRDQPRPPAAAAAVQERQQQAELVVTADQRQSSPALARAAPIPARGRATPRPARTSPLRSPRVTPGSGWNGPLLGTSRHRQGRRRSARPPPGGRPC